MNISNIFRNSPNKNAIIPYAILLMAWLCTFLLSAYSEWYGDDMMFKYFCRGEVYETREIETPGDIIYSQANHYINANGRFIAHVLVQLFCAFWGPVIFGIFNAFAYIALILLILSFINSSIYNTKALLSVTILIVLCFSTKMMPSCQIGYIWSFVVGLTFIKIFLNDKKISPWWWLPLFIFAIIAGNFHEGVNFGIAGALFVWFIINLRHISAHQWIMLIGFGIGALFIVLSPASRDRAASAHVPLALSIANLLHYGLGLYVLAGALIAVWRNKHTNFSLKELVKTNYFFLSAVIFSLMLNLAISIGTSRQLYGMNLFCIIVALYILPRKSMSAFWIIITGIFAALHLTIQVHDTWKMRMFTEDLSRQLATIDGLPGQAATLFVDSYPASKCWHSPLDSYVENNSFTGEGNLKKLQYDLHQRYPQKTIKVLPKYLQALDSVAENRGLIKLGNGIYLLYCRKTESVQHISAEASRCIGIPGTPFWRPYHPVRYSLEDTTSIIYPYKDFKAMVVSQWDYNPIIRISDVRIVSAQ